jgi:regulator of protease activity HflC (stomatin/prohibitin superfamily)
VADYEDRLYSDVQLAARRSLASMTLEQILTHRTCLSDDILADVHTSAAGYGVEILRADVKDLIDAEARAETLRVQAAAEAERERLAAQAELDAMQQRRQVADVYASSPALLRLRELQALRELAQVANARIYIGFPKHVDTSEPDGQ